MASHILSNFSVRFTLDTYAYVTTSAQKDVAQTMENILSMQIRLSRRQKSLGRTNTSSQAFQIFYMGVTRLNQHLTSSFLKDITVTVTTIAVHTLSDSTVINILVDSIPDDKTSCITMQMLYMGIK